MKSRKVLTGRVEHDRRFVGAANRLFRQPEGGLPGGFPERNARFGFWIADGDRVTDVAANTNVNG